jgi:biofilm PGA synthesis N-glycosyltransferase PgaC
VDNYPYIKIRNTQQSQSDNSPELSIIIAAYNEEKVIRERIENIARQDYDLAKVQVLVGSDCSSDATNQILKELDLFYPWLETHLFNYRQGKAGVINTLIGNAKNEILVFTDANTVFKEDTLKELVKYYSDENVGGVSGRLILEDSAAIKSEGVEEKSYWEFETKIKKAEGNLGILIGANGGIFSIRKQYFNMIPIKKAVTDDFYLSLAVLNQGKKYLYAEKAVAYEDVGQDLNTEFKRKVRFASTNFQVLSFFKSLLFNKNLLLSYAFWSHKVIRWFTPILLIIILIASSILSGYSTIIKYLFFAQVLFYLFSLIRYAFIFS